MNLPTPFLKSAARLVLHEFLEEILKVVFYFLLIFLILPKKFKFSLVVVSLMIAIEPIFLKYQIKVYLKALSLK